MKQTVTGWVLLGLLALFGACAPSPPLEAGRSAVPVTINEASGVALDDGVIYVVDDSVNSAYFRADLPEGAGPIVALNDLGPLLVPLPAGIWVDLESIDRLADGRMVVLSERLRGLVSDDGPVAEYDYELSEFGRRGLEGLAVRPLPDRSSRVAVLWEGGYPDTGSLQRQIEKSAGGVPLLPVFFVHDIPEGASGMGRIRWKDGLFSGVLKAPEPSGEPPAAQRFRAPDLVWYRWPERRAEEWGFLVLMSSQNGAGKPRFLHHWLQRFDLQGTPVGEPLNLEGKVSAELAHANWEGLDWREMGKSVILVHEASGDLPPHALILELPPDWQFEPGE